MFFCFHRRFLQSNTLTVTCLVTFRSETTYRKCWFVLVDFWDDKVFFSSWFLLKKGINFSSSISFVRSSICPISYTCSLTLHKHVFSDVLKWRCTLASVALNTLAPMLFCFVLFHACDNHNEPYPTTAWKLDAISPLGHRLHRAAFCTDSRHWPQSSLLLKFFRFHQRSLKTPHFWKISGASIQFSIFRLLWWYSRGSSALRWKKFDFWARFRRKRFQKKSISSAFCYLSPHSLRLSSFLENSIKLFLIRSNFSNWWKFFGCKKLESNNVKTWKFSKGNLLKFFSVNLRGNHYRWVKEASMSNQLFLDFFAPYAENIKNISYTLSV